MSERGSKTPTVPVVWANLEFFSARSKLLPVGHDWWQWTKPGYITMTRRPGDPTPKKFRVQESAGKVIASIFWDQDGILHIDYLPNGQTNNAECHSSLLVQLKDILKEKRSGMDTKGSYSCTSMPWLTGLLQLRSNWPTWASSVLITHPITGTGPAGLSTVPWTEKTIERSLFFVRRGGHCWRGDQVGRTNFWIFLSGLQKLEQRAEKCVELRGEYVA